MYTEFFNFEVDKKNEKNDIIRNEYTALFVEKITNLYKIKSEKIKMRSELITLMCLVNGHVGCTYNKEKDKLIFGMGNFTSAMDEDGFKEYTFTTLDGKQTYSGKVGEDILVLSWFDICIKPIYMLKRYCDMLAKIDVSMELLTLYTRLLPIPIVRDDQEQKSLETVLDGIYSGVRKVFKREQYADLFDTSAKTKENNTLDITSPQATVYIQNLSRFHDEMVIRICLEFGIHITARDKGAQLNENELNAFQDYSALSSSDTWENIQRFKQECKDVFAVEIEIEKESFVTTNDEIRKEKNSHDDIKRDIQK